MSISDQNCIQILHGLSIIRVYYIKKEFYINIVDIEMIKPAIFKKAYQAKNYLIEELKNKKNIDFHFYYRTDLDINKKIQILDLNGYYYDDIDKLINRALLLLID